MANLAADVNTMRERILRELSAGRGSVNAALQAHAADLQRSNSELEQFAYVASHDLQEPLRKVASFSQLLQRRYAGQLDARADQYIEFAVDGAKRMQALINDLLAFSRVGQAEREPTLVSSDSALTQARANLADEIEKTGATIETGHLPLVLAEVSLLTAVFQNLLSNALKFAAGSRRASSSRPAGRSRSGCSRSPTTAWGSSRSTPSASSCSSSDSRPDSYAGTGIGLAMCRKIIENFGGQIWLDTTATEGTRFCFTLPMPPRRTRTELEPPDRPWTEDPDEDTHG